MTQFAKTDALKLDEIRKTVDEKLQGTLEQRLGASFKLVSDQLEKVFRGIGEMQSLATGVGDLKKDAQQREDARRMGRGISGQPPRSSIDHRTIRTKR